MIFINPVKRAVELFPTLSVSKASAAVWERDPPLSLGCRGWLFSVWLLGLELFQESTLWFTIGWTSDAKT